MSRKKLVERKLACETIHNVSVSKVGQVILKKNPQETRVLIDKLEGLEIHKRRWKNEFCGKVYDAREEFKQTRITSFVRSTSTSKGTKKSMTTNFTNRREFLRLERETGELDFTNNRIKTKKQEQRVAKNLHKIPPKQ